MTDKRELTDEQPPEFVKSLEGMRHVDKLRLVAAVLEFFVTDPGYPEARPIRALTGDDRFAGYSPDLLAALVKCLVAAGLMFRPPPFAARSAAYVTTREGRQVRDKYLRLLQQQEG